MAETQLLPKPRTQEHPIALFNNQGLDWHPNSLVSIPSGLPLSYESPEQTKIAIHGAVHLGDYEDERTKQKLHTLWTHKEQMEDPNRPVVFYAAGIGAHLTHPDMHARAWQLSRQLQDAPVFMVDYPNVPAADDLTREQKKGLRDDNAFPLLYTWIDAMKKEGLSGREIHIIGESMGGFYAVELARLLAQLAHNPEPGHDDPHMRVTKLHIVDPAGVHKYDHAIEALDTLEYMKDFLSDGHENDLFYKDSVRNRYVREINELDAHPLRQARITASWMADRLWREKPPIFYYGSIIAHGGIPEKLDELMGLDKDLTVTVTNFTNSRVCPHNEVVDMIDGRRIDGERAVVLAAKYNKHKKRIRAIYEPGDGHGAVLVHERLAHMSRQALHEDTTVNPERARATQRIVEELGRKIHASFDAPENPLEKRDYHSTQHSSRVRMAARQIMEIVLKSRGASAQERERLLDVTDVASYAHDAFQNESIEESVDAFGITVRKRRPRAGDQPGDSEYDSARLANELMDAENSKAGREIFSQEDKGKAAEAILGTIPTWTDRGLEQQHLPPTASPVAHSVAIADLYNQYMFNGNPVAPNLFRELNVDILKRLHTDKVITDGNYQKSIKARMNDWIIMQRQFVTDMQEMLQSRLEALSPGESGRAVRDQVAGLMRFDMAEKAMNEFSKKHRAFSASFESLLDLWGYHENPDRYNPNLAGTRLPTEPVD